MCIRDRLTISVDQPCLRRWRDWIDHERFREMLGAKIREGAYRFPAAHRFLLLIGFVCGAIHLKLFIDSAVSAFYEALIFLLTLQHSYAKALAIRSHLGNVSCDKWYLDYQVDLARTLDRERPICLSILVRNTLFGKRSVLENYVDLAPYGIQ